MRILIIINNLGVGGAERLVVDDINEMLKRGLNIKLITLKPEKENKSLASECNLNNQHWVKINFGSLLNLISWARVTREILNYKPDIIIAHLWFSNFIGKVASMICRTKKLIIFEHNVYDDLKTWKMFLFDKFTQNMVTKIIAVSGAVKNSLIRHGIREDKIVVILNGVDTSKYKIIKDKTNSKFIFIFIGRLIDQKGVDVLLKAFIKLNDSELWIVGDGSKKEEYIKLVENLNIQKNVKFLGVRKDIPELLASSDCFVLPSRYEGLPIVLLEAVTACKAIIVSDFESAKEVIKHDFNGLIVKREDEVELSQKMIEIKENKKLFEKLKSNIYMDSNKYSIENHVDQILSLI